MTILTYDDSPEEAWQRWSNKKDKTNTQDLLKRFKPLMYKEVYRQSGVLPRSYLMSEAMNLSYNALNSYDPKQNTKLATHVANNLKGLARANFTYQNAARITESRQRKYSEFINVKKELQDKYGRSPSTVEMSSKLKWSPQEIGRMERDIHSESTTSNTELPDFDAGLAVSHEPVIDFIYHDLTAEEKVLFESLTGYNGHPVLSIPELSKKMNLSVPQIRRRKDKLAAHIKRIV